MAKQLKEAQSNLPSQDVINKIEDEAYELMKKPKYSRYEYPESFNRALEDAWKKHPEENAKNLAYAKAFWEYNDELSNMTVGILDKMNDIRLEDIEMYSETPSSYLKYVKYDIASKNLKEVLGKNGV